VQYGAATGAFDPLAGRLIPGQNVLAAGMTPQVDCHDANSRLVLRRWTVGLRTQMVATSPPHDPEQTHSLRPMICKNSKAKWKPKILLQITLYKLSAL
jgi:hypothetical protein